MNWKSTAKTGAGYLLGFTLAALALPVTIQWLMPSCIHYRAGCMGVDVWKIVGIKARLGIIIAATAYVAIGKITEFNTNTSTETDTT